VTWLQAGDYGVTIVTVPSSNSGCLATRKPVITLSDRQARRQRDSSRGAHLPLGRYCGSHRFPRLEPCYRS